MVTYEQRLNNNLGWALREGSMHFEKDSAVHKSCEFQDVAARGFASRGAATAHS